MSAPLLSTVVDDNVVRPHVSVVMPTYNRAFMLRKTVDMVLGQTLHELELIIVDDHSTDNTETVVKEIIERDKRVCYHKPNRKGGITLVVNEGIMLSKGHYVQICHDHDIYRPTLTEKLARVLDRNPSVAFVHPGRQGCDHAFH